MPYLKHLLTCLIFAIIFTAQMANAHPHILIDAEVKFHVSKNATNQHQLDSLSYKWRFDENFSFLLIGDYDDDQDQLLNQQELTTMGIETMEGAKELGYFTHLATATQSITPLDAPQVLASLSDNRLTLEFSLSLDQPIILNTDFKFKLFDDEYYTAFTFPLKNGYEIIGDDASNCSISQTQQGQDDKNLAIALENAFTEDTTNQGMGARFADEMGIKCG